MLAGCFVQSLRHPTSSWDSLPSRGWTRRHTNRSGSAPFHVCLTPPQTHVSFDKFYGGVACPSMHGVWSRSCDEGTESVIRLLGFFSLLAASRLTLRVSLQAHPQAAPRVYCTDGNCRWIRSSRWNAYFGHCNYCCAVDSSGADRKCSSDHCFYLDRRSTVAVSWLSFRLRLPVEFETRDSFLGWYFQNGWYLIIANR